MATLNVKNFPDDLYERLRALADREQRSVAQQVIRLLDQAVASTEARSILELRGLGRSLWQQHEDAARFVAEERRSWD